MLDAELPYRIAVGGTWIIGYAIRLYYERRARSVQRVSASARVRDEEQMLIDQFGDEYRAYMRRTGRLIPKILSG